MASPHPRDVVVVGASAGGVEALRDFVGGLPADLPATVLVVLHLPARGRSVLADILGRSGPLPAYPASHGSELEHGVVLTAPANHHLVLVDGYVALSQGPTENRHRPAINALFRSAAVAAGPRVTGVLLSGMLDDGVAGLVSIASRGGRVLVQDLDDALYAGMPRHALETLTADHVLPASDMGPILDKISREEVDLNLVALPSEQLRLEDEIARSGSSAQVARDPGRLGPMSGLTCPDCDGGLIEISPGSRYRCRIGHAWTAEALLDAHGGGWERALWVAIRTLDEKAALSRRVADRARAGGRSGIAKRYDDLAGEVLKAAAVLREPLGIANARDREVTG